MISYKRIGKVASVALSVSIIYGCANSASHRVVKTEKIGDEALSCSELRTEKRKAQIIISGVEQDKADMTGADLVDGILWFPFNVIAKQSNYASATKAAEDRIDYLSSVEMEKGCKAGKYADREGESDAVATRQIRQLNGLYKEGVLTKEEYLQKRAAILSRVSSQKSESEIREDQKKMGQYSPMVESLAKNKGCYTKGFAELVSKTGPIEIYKVECLEAEPMIVRCEYQDCSFLNLQSAR